MELLGGLAVCGLYLFHVGILCDAEDFVVVLGFATLEGDFGFPQNGLDLFALIRMLRGGFIQCPYRRLVIFSL